MIRLAIADDQILFLRGLRLMLEDFSNIDIVVEANNGRELLDAMKHTPVDVVLLDLRMPEMDGIEATRRLRESYPQTKVLLLSMHDDERLISHLMNLGASGYLLKDEEPETVREAIESVHERDFYFNEYVSKALLQGMKTRNNIQSVDAHLQPQLTRRELEVLALICKEYTTAEIAKELYLSSRTVDGHRRNLQEKTGAKNVAGLVIYAIRSGIVKL